MTDTPENETQPEHTPAYMEALADLLGLVLDDPPTPDQVAAWTFEQRQEAERWASLEHLAASDNRVVRLPVPQFLIDQVAQAEAPPAKYTAEPAVIERAGALLNDMDDAAEREPAEQALARLQLGTATWDDVITFAQLTGADWIETEVGALLPSGTTEQPEPEPEPEPWRPTVNLDLSQRDAALADKQRRDAELKELRDGLARRYCRSCQGITYQRGDGEELECFGPHGGLGVVHGAGE